MEKYTLIQGLCLFEVDDIESHLPLPTILHRKIKPLQMSPRVGIDAQVEIVLSLAHPHHAVQIPTLKITIED